jgi:formylglycine-generating enzyme required for sulfatase activity
VPSVEAFLAELREAVESSGPTAQTARETGRSLDLNETLLAPAGPTVAPPQQTTSQVDFDSMAGTISSAALSAEEQAKLSASQAAYEHEQQLKNRIAREELAREAETRHTLDQERERKKEEAARKLKEEEDRLRREREEREERERQQHEQMERVERQAKELEDRLARLATSMPPQVGVIDPEATQVHQGVKTETVGNNSFPGVTPALSASAPRLEVAIPAKPKSNSLMIGVVVLIILLIGGGLGAYFLLLSKPSTGVNANNPTPAPTSGPDTPIKADLVEIPGGTFQMGRNNGPLQETPAHQISVQSFFMDKTEVTNAEYAEFVRESHHAPPSDWNGTKPPYGTEMWPVLNVSLDDVNAFADWRSKRDNVVYRLPTEQEWEYAARNGEQSDLYPWGKDWKDNQAVLKEATPQKVGSHPEGNNKWGVADLIGNVWEWTSSKVSAYPGNPTPIPTATRDWMVIRGAGYDRNPSDKDNPVSSCIRTFVSPGSKIPQLGFRLVRSAQ